MNGWRLGKRPALDGLRAVAIGLVVLSHAFGDVFPNGGVVGVTVFFALSGFLITSLLVEERTDHGRIRLGAFYMRRALRLFPAIGVLIAAALAGWVVVGDRITTPLQALATALYVGNWVRAGGETLGVLSHTWSLAIEEQFYLVWPLVLIGAWRVAGRGGALVAAAVGVAASILVRILVWHGPESADRVYFGSDTRADSLLLGCVFALAISGRPGWASRASLASAAALACVALSLPLAGVTWSYLVLPTVAAVVSVLALVSLAGSGYRGWLAHPAAVYVGRRSYGLYLWHVPAFGFMNDLTSRGVPLVLAVLVLTGLSWAATYLSYRFVEAPFLRIKDRTHGRLTHPAAAQPPASPAPG